MEGLILSPETKYTVIVTEKPSVAQEYKKVLNIKPTEKTDGYIKGYNIPSF